ncbi:MAG: mannose-1-phosphate guanylyltransferase/mannose-6-phosphate isomerase [Gammaproteobacteria bacterium]|nr:mannose-1-phosphate guanylyltransferase/mannose-6-phosphate isomerase [Gammaproteobacteria bacterium]NNJ96213.1 mannose-1-phosphate guanylyltransferase/mannose-6-phosphate isomerase [Gammaproteobacteria bacterium]
MIIPVILSGGSGTRLWPLSRRMHPKQLLPLVNETSMLQDTISRLTGSPDIDHVMVLCNDDYRFMVAEQVKETDIATNEIILEPMGRNTAPAIALAAFNAVREGDDPVLLVLPADHVIADVETFQSALQLGKQQSEAGRLVTFGIVADTPETGFGYIKALSTGNQETVYEVDQFVEKPDAETAANYIADGHYYWNSGMFMFKASTYLEALKLHSADIYQASQAAFNAAIRDSDFVRVGKSEFENCPSDSIDYAVMEKVDNAVVIPVDIGWSDVGSWSALHDVGDVDDLGNTLIGDVKSGLTTNSYVRANNRLVVTLGVDNMIVVDTDDALLVANRDNVHDIKTIVEQLSKENRAEVNLHKCVYRPWGHYQGIDAGPHYQVKRITVSPAAAISLQLHHHRSEHWIVVSGTAKVTRGDEEFIISENESTYIPLGEKHRLENIGKIPLRLIEVQTGSYLGEDDIVRFEDIYGR